MMMRKHLIEIFLPLFDKHGRRIPLGRFKEVHSELTDRFGGLTAHTRAPAVGIWKPRPAGRAERDLIVIYEVMSSRLDAQWWATYRRALERRFGQEKVLVRARPVRTL
jgi:hypothetical protein